MNNSGQTARGRPFPKGTSGNPNGRPPSEWTWKSLLQEAVEEVEDGVPIKKIIARKLVEKAKSPDVQAFNAIADRMEGRAAQAVELTGKDGGPVEQSLVVSFVDSDDSSSSESH